MGKHTDELIEELVISPQGKTACKQWNSEDGGGYERVLPPEILHYVGKTWDEIKNQATLPATAKDFNIFFATEQHRRIEIQNLLDEVAHIDAEIDETVLDLYGIMDTSDRQRMLGSAATSDENVDVDVDEGSEETE